jgi:hypothetical protein
VRSERYAVFVKTAQVAQAEDLETAAVGENRAIPGHEPVEAAECLDYTSSRSQGQMIGVAENGMGANGPQILRRQRLYGCLRPNRHEDRSLELSVRGAHLANSRFRPSVARNDAEGD